MTAFTLMINGVQRQIEAEPQMPLLWVLRDMLGLTGAKFGCGIGQCGTCTVLVDGVAQRSCLLPISAVIGAITTIEGLSPDGQHPVQKAWHTEAVAQCGYCQAGHIMTAVALLTQTPQPTDEAIHAAYADALCRCGTYLRIKRAIQRAALGGG